MNIREIFKNDVSGSAFKVVDNAIRIIGKYGEIEVVGDRFDIWFVDRETPLSQRKITAILKKLPSISGVSVVNGEIWYQTNDPEEVRSILPIMGVRKRMTYSDETLEKMRERGKKAAKNIRKR